MMEAARALSNWLSLIAVTAVLWSLFRIASYLKEAELRSSVIKLAVFFVVTAGAVFLLEKLAGGVNSRGGAEGLIIFSIAFLIAVIVEIAWYVRVLQRFAAHIEAYVNREQIAEPPTAVARVAE